MAYVEAPTKIRAADCDIRKQASKLMALIKGERLVLRLSTLFLSSIPDALHKVRTFYIKLQ